MPNTSEQRSRRRLWIGTAVLIVLSVVVVALYSVSVPAPELPAHVPQELVPRFQQAHQFIWPKVLVGWVWPAVMVLAIWLIAESRSAVRIEERFGKDRVRRWPVRLLFLAAVWLFILAISIPSGVRSFLHSREYGLTEIATLEWFRIVLTETPLNLVLFLLKFLFIFCVIAIFHRRWWFAAAVLIFVIFNLVPEKLSLTLPVDPVRTFVRLDDGPYRDAMTEVAELSGENLEFYVEDRSQRAETVNMYMTGRIGREYVVVTDTLLGQLDPDEVAAVFAHELGHKVTRPVTIPLNMAIGVGKMLLVFYLVHLVFRRQAVPETLRLQALVYIYLSVQLVGQLVRPVSAAVYRYQEREADHYALELTEDADALRGALLKVSAANLDPYEVPAWLYYLRASHPLLRDRLKMTDDWEQGAS